MTSAHTLVAQACLCILLHLDEKVTRHSLAKFSLAEYAAQHWFEHARIEGVWENADEGMKQLFDKGKPHFGIWLWIYDPTALPWKRHGLERAERPQPPRGTALHYAAFCGLHEVVKILVIEHSEDVNSRTFGKGSTPLHLTCQDGHVDIARFLVKHGADATAQNEDGSTALHSASSRGDLDLARFLVEHGADAAAQNIYGSTALHSASSRGHLDLARFLVEHGADVAARNKNGQTPLHLASSSGHLDLARFLVEHGANSAAQDDDALTPLDLASVEGYV